MLTHIVLMHISYRFPQINLIQWHILIAKYENVQPVNGKDCHGIHQSTLSTYNNHLVLLSRSGIRGSWSFEKRQQFLLYQVGAAKTSNKSNVKWMPENQSHSNHNEWLESYIFRKTSCTSLFMFRPSHFQIISNFLTK